MSGPPYVLGVSAFYHDSAAALIANGHIAAAAQEERFSRIKNDAAFPIQAIRYCLDAAGCAPADISHVAFYDKPFLKFERLLETYIAFAPRGFRSFRMAMPLWLREKLFLKPLLGRHLAELDPGIDWQSRLLFGEHHQSHAAAAFFPSPFERAAILTMDGVGEWATTSAALGNGSEIDIVRELHFPHSLGLLYAAFTYYIGFRVNADEYKVMGLAPYGEPRFATSIRDHLIDIKPDGSFRLEMDYFDFATGLTMTNSRFDALFGGPPRAPDAPLTQRDMDLAASIQAITEEVVLSLVRATAAETGERNLCLAGGVALNCVANGKVLRDGAFENIWVPPAAGDAGGALGAALTAWHAYLGKARMPAGNDAMQGALLGPAYSQAEIEARLTTAGATFEVLDDAALLDTVVQALADGLAIGWFQGRMEFGPRALGSRSILADPRVPTMQATLNRKVKNREDFRPFAPAVLGEHTADWFELETDSPYMALVADVAPSRRLPIDSAQQALTGFERLGVVRSQIPAVTHVDGSARIQTVGDDANPRFRALLERFYVLTGCPVLVNTSFNGRDEPIVNTPEEAWRCFAGSALDLLAIGNCIMRKKTRGDAP